MYVEKSQRKISIIGTGAVGSAIAYAIMMRGFADKIVLIDTNKKLANAELLDIKHGLHNIPCAELVCGDYSDIKDSSIIIVTAGRSRREGESRLDLAQDNIKIAAEIAENIKTYYNTGVVIVVSNPVDIITYYMTKHLNLAKGKVFGTGCMLDSSRLSAILTDYLGKNVEIPVIGEHGNFQIPLWSAIGECGLSESQKAAMEDDVRSMGAEIIAGKGKTFYGIATCAAVLAGAIISDIPICTSVSTVLDGEYGIKDTALSIPCLINSNGAKILSGVTLSDEEREKLLKTANFLHNEEV